MKKKLVNGLIEGPRKVYYNNGQVYFEYHFTLGDYQGPYTVYFPDGKVQERGMYKFDEAARLP